MEKLSLAQIVGRLTASQKIVEIELKATLKVYGNNIPAYVIEGVLEDLQKRMKDSEEEWENREI